ncbi:hypothetical protein [Phormidium pseudopriestleyi]|nr:hypothetical protein [Phormidium pseudopriestleyi]
MLQVITIQHNDFWGEASGMMEGTTASRYYEQGITTASRYYELISQ